MLRVLQPGGRDAARDGLPGVCAEQLRLLLLRLRL